MGQNFGTIMIKRIQKDEDTETKQVLSKLELMFEKDKEELSYNEFLNEKWDRANEGLIGIFFNDHIIIIEDEYELIKNSFLRELSDKLNTEIVKAVNSDSSGISLIQIYDHGNLIRMKSFGLENDLNMLSSDELKSVEGIGKPTKYEENGSDANNVFNSFIRGKIKAEEINSMTIYKEK